MTGYVIQCGRGNAISAELKEDGSVMYSASCVDLPAPGDTYTMTVIVQLAKLEEGNITSSISLVAGMYGFKQNLL